MNPSKLEQRIAKLEREITFVKAQGLSRDEQEVLLQEEGSAFIKNPSIFKLWVVIALQFGLIFYLFYKSEIEGVQSTETTQSTEIQSKDILSPKRNQPFMLPE